MDLQTFIGEINAEPSDDSTVTVYRGHSSRSFMLRPNIFRSSAYRANEHLLLRDLVAMHPDQFATDTSALEMLVRMQHYSLPTRLLDASWNPLVGLYFAAQSKKIRVSRPGSKVRVSREADGEVVRLIVDKKLVRYFDSDTVSCLANLARGDSELKDDIRKLIADKHCNDTEAGIEWFNAKRPIKRLVHFISAEKPAFAPDIVPSDLSRVFLVKPKLSNRRILAQEGCFFAFGLTDEMPASGAHGIRIQRIIIPADDKVEILSQLKRVAINERTMFPEIERAAKYLTEDVSATAILSRTV